MSRVLRGAWARRGILGSLVAMTAVVVAGTVVVIGFAGAAGTSRLLAAPLLLLGAVAVPAIGRELAGERREEIGLARLRGIRGPRLVAVLLTEPLLAVLLGLLLGLGGGLLGARLAVSTWLDGGDAALGTTAVLAALATAAGGLVVTMLGYATALREPLAAQVSIRARPRRATTLAAFGSVLVLAGAAVAVQRSRVQTDAGPDLVVLLGPALLGLAVGQAAVWLLRGLARLAAARTGAAGLASFLASRRVARADDLVGPLRLVVAAGVVGVLALTGSQAVSSWSDTQARLQTLGTRTVPVEGGPVRALALTERLDPGGRWLMASTLVPGDASLGGRRGYVEAARYDAVVGGFLDGTPASQPPSAMTALAPDAPAPVTSGDRMAVTARSLTGPTTLQVEVTYVGGDNTLTSAQTVLDLAPGRPAAASVRLDGCATACLPTGMSVSAGTSGASGFEVAERPADDRVLISGLSFGGSDLLDLAWVPGDNSATGFIAAERRAEASARLVLNRPDGLEVRPLTGVATELAPERPATVPVLLTRAGSPAEGFGSVGGDDRRIVEVGTAPVLPLVGRVGAVGDLATAVGGSAPAVPGAVTAVVVADGSPGGLVDRLAEESGARPEPVDDVRADVATAAGGAQAWGYALMAGAALAVALLALVAGAARHRRSYRHDVAALRSVGIPTGVVRRAGRAELVGLAVVVALAVALGGWLAVRLLLPGLPLIAVPPAALPLDTGTRPPALLVAAVVAGAAVVLLGGRARSVTSSSTAPAILREGPGEAA